MDLNAVLWCSSYSASAVGFLLVNMLALKPLYVCECLLANTTSTSSACTQDELKNFLNNALASSGAAVTDGPAINHVRINQDKSFAFVELRSVEEATNATALNGIRFKGSVLKVRQGTTAKDEYMLLLMEVWGICKWK